MDYKSFKTKIYPNSGEKILLSEDMAAVGNVYNKMVEISKTFVEEHISQYKKKKEIADKCKIEKKKPDDFKFDYTYDFSSAFSIDNTMKKNNLYHEANPYLCKDRNEDEDEQLRCISTGSLECLCANFHAIIDKYLFGRSRGYSIKCGMPTFKPYKSFNTISYRKLKPSCVVPKNGKCRIAFPNLRSKQIGNAGNASVGEKKKAWDAYKNNAINRKLETIRTIEERWKELEGKKREDGKPMMRNPSETIKSIREEIETYKKASIPNEKGILVNIKAETLKGRLIKSCTITKDRFGEWWISISTTSEIDENDRKADFSNGRKILGIDMGVRKTATLSDGTVYEPNEKIFQLSDEIERRKSNIDKFKALKGENGYALPIKSQSKRYQRENLKINKLYRKICRISDFETKLTAHMIVEKALDEKYNEISMEDLNLVRMLSDARTEEEKKDNKSKGRHVHKIMRSVRIGQLMNLIEQKCQKHGIKVTKVDPKDTSRMCNGCGHTELTLGSKEKWTCPSCGMEHDRDVNAAKNMAYLAESGFLSIKEFKESIESDEKFNQNKETIEVSILNGKARTTKNKNKVKKLAKAKKTN